MIIIAALGGLLAGVLIAVAWTAGCRQGRADVLDLTRALNSLPAGRDRLAEDAVPPVKSVRY
jgi:hypothetical protein